MTSNIEKQKTLSTVESRVLDLFTFEVEAHLGEWEWISSTERQITGNDLKNETKELRAAYGDEAVIAAFESLAERGFLKTSPSRSGAHVWYALPEL